MAQQAARSDLGDGERDAFRTLAAATPDVRDGGHRRVHCGAGRSGAIGERRGVAPGHRSRPATALSAVALAAGRRRWRAHPGADGAAAAGCRRDIPADAAAGFRRPRRRSACASGRAVNLTFKHLEAKLRFAELSIGQWAGVLGGVLFAMLFAEYLSPFHGLGGADPRRLPRRDPGQAPRSSPGSATSTSGALRPRCSAGAACAAVSCRAADTTHAATSSLTDRDSLRRSGRRRRPWTSTAVVAVTIAQRVSPPVAVRHREAVGSSRHRRATWSPSRQSIGRDWS